MKFKKIAEKYNASGFLFSEGHVVHRNDEDDLYIDNQFFRHNVSSYPFFIDDQVFYRDKDTGFLMERNLYANTEEKVKCKDDFILLFSPNTIHNNTVIRSYSRTSPVKDRYLVRLDNFEKIKSLSLIEDKITYVRYGDILIIAPLDPSHLSAYSIAEEKILWEIDLKAISISDEPRMRFQFRFQIDHLCYFVIDQHTLLEVDILEGKIVRKWGELPEEEHWKAGSWKHTGIPVYTAFCLIDNTVFGVYETGYWEIDLNTGLHRIKPLSVYFKEQHFRPLRSGIMLDRKGDHVLLGSYFYINTPTIERSVALFNIKTLKIDWKYDFTQEEIGFNIKNYHFIGDKMYVMGDNKKLHIFEQDKT